MATTPAPRDVPQFLQDAVSRALASEEDSGDAHAHLIQSCNTLMEPRGGCGYWHVTTHNGAELFCRQGEAPRERDFKVIVEGYVTAAGCVQPHLYHTRGSCIGGTEADSVSVYKRLVGFSDMNPAEYASHQRGVVRMLAAYNKALCQVPLTDIPEWVHGALCNPWDQADSMETLLQVAAPRLALEPALVPCTSSGCCEEGPLHRWLVPCPVSGTSACDGIGPILWKPANHDVILKALTQLQHHGRQYAALPKQLTHGDAGWGNVMVQDAVGEGGSSGERQYSLIDFTPYATETHLYAVLAHLYWVYIHAEPTQDCRTVCWSDIHTWLAQYHALYPIPEQTLAMLPTAFVKLGLRMVFTLVFFADRGGDVPGFVTVPSFERYVAELKLLLDAQGTLDGIARTMCSGPILLQAVELRAECNLHAFFSTKAAVDGCRVLGGDGGGAFWACCNDGLHANYSVGYLLPPHSRDEVDRTSVLSAAAARFVEGLGAGQGALWWLGPSSGRGNVTASHLAAAAAAAAAAALETNGFHSAGVEFGMELGVDPCLSRSVRLMWERCRLALRCSGATPTPRYSAVPGASAHQATKSVSVGGGWGSEAGAGVEEGKGMEEGPGLVTAATEGAASSIPAPVPLSTTTSTNAGCTAGTDAADGAGGGGRGGGGAAAAGIDTGGGDGGDHGGGADATATAGGVWSIPTSRSETLHMHHLVKQAGAPPPGFAVEWVRTRQQFTEFVDALGSACGYTADRKLQCEQVYAAAHRIQSCRALGATSVVDAPPAPWTDATEHRGEGASLVKGSLAHLQLRHLASNAVVSTASLFFPNPSALQGVCRYQVGLYDVSTVTAFRKRGLASYLVAVAICEAVWLQPTVRHVVIQATEAGVGMYERAGFVRSVGVSPTFAYFARQPRETSPRGTSTRA